MITTETLDQLVDHTYAELFGPASPSSPSPEDQARHKLTLRHLLAQHRELVVRTVQAEHHATQSLGLQCARYGALLEKYALAIIANDPHLGPESNGLSSSDMAKAVLTAAHTLALEHQQRLDAFQRSPSPQD